MALTKQQIYEAMINAAKPKPRLPTSNSVLKNRPASKKDNFADLVAALKAKNSTPLKDTENQ